jgi:preprotein translocase subunit YajC
VLISNAYAQAAVGSSLGGDGMQSILMMVAMVAAMYFLMIRPQMKKAKEHKNLIEALGKGDEVVTQGGIAGRITKVGDDFVAVSIADNVEIQVQKPAITLVLPKGTLKNL